MSEWTRVAATTEIDDGGWRVIDIDGVQVAVVHSEGEFHAIEDVCTHDGGALSGGKICGAVIECPRHGARFDLRSGRVLCPPAYTDATIFPIRIEDGVVWVRDDRWD